MEGYKKQLIKKYHYSLETYLVDKERVKRLKEIKPVEYFIYLCPYKTMGALAKYLGFDQANLSHIISDVASVEKFNILKDYVKNTTGKTLLHSNDNVSKIATQNKELDKQALLIAELRKENASLRKLVKQEIDLLNNRKDTFLKGVDYVINKALYELGKEVK